MLSSLQELSIEIAYCTLVALLLWVYTEIICQNPAMWVIYPPYFSYKDTLSNKGAPNFFLQVYNLQEREYWIL